MTGIDAEAIDKLLTTGMTMIEPTRLTGDGKIVDDPDVPADLISAVLPEGHRIVVEDLARPGLRDAPRRITGTTQVRDVTSFLDYWEKYATESSEVYADPDFLRITGVLNAPADADTPAWSDHRVILTPRVTEAWERWERRNGDLMGQHEFAEFLEEAVGEIVNPSAADMLELAQQFEATTGVQFESGARVSSGERRLVYRETVEARAGSARNIDIPTEITLHLAAFDGVEAAEVKALFRYRIAEGQLLLGYKIPNLRLIRDASFVRMVDKIREADETGRLIAIGLPRT